MIHSGRVIFFLLLLSSPSGDAFRIHTKKGRSSQKTVIKVGRELGKDGGPETHSDSGSNSTPLRAEVGNASVDLTYVCCRCRRAKHIQHKVCPDLGGYKVPIFGEVGKRLASCSPTNCNLDAGWTCGMGIYQKCGIGAPYIAGHVPTIVAVSDPGQDPDDEMSFIMMKHLSDMGYIKEVAGVVTTLWPQEKRALLARASLNLLGLKHVPVGIGSDGGDIEKPDPKGGVKHEHSAEPFEGATKYAGIDRNPNTIQNIGEGQELMMRIYKDAKPKSITLLIIASLKDAAIFMTRNLDLFVDKTYEVVIMGGIQALPNKGGFLLPNSANNQKFDTNKAEAHKNDPDQVAFDVFRQCQENNVRLVILSREAVYGVGFPRNFYDKMAVLNPIAKRLQDWQQGSIETLWIRACDNDENTDDRPQGLRDVPRLMNKRCNSEWFMKTFLGGKKAKRWESIWHLVVQFYQYDSMALLAAVPGLRSLFFEPIIVKVKDTEHEVIGFPEGTTNIRKQTKDKLTRWLTEGFVDALKSVESQGYGYRALPANNDALDI